MLKNVEIKANRPDIDKKLKEGDVCFATSRFQMTEILPQIKFTEKFKDLEIGCGI